MPETKLTAIVNSSKQPHNPCHIFILLSLNEIYKVFMSIYENATVIVFENTRLAVQSILK